MNEMINTVFDLAFRPLYFPTVKKILGFNGMPLAGRNGVRDARRAVGALLSLVSDQTEAMTVMPSFAGCKFCTTITHAFGVNRRLATAISGRTLPTRRTLLLGGFVYLSPNASRAQDLSYRGWRFSVGSGVAPLSDDLIRSLQAQIDIVESLDIKPEIKTFFRSVPLEIDKTTAGGAGAYSFREHRMFLSTHVDAPEKPVFLHELLHAYHDLKLPDGVRNRQIIKTYQDAERRQTFRSDAYMMKNEREFFAMCASVVLWGRAARPPSTRETVREKLPDFYDWIVAEFGFVPNPDERTYNWSLDLSKEHLPQSIEDELDRKAR